MLQGPGDAGPFYRRGVDVVALLCWRARASRPYASMGVVDAWIRKGTFVICVTSAAIVNGQVCQEPGSLVPESRCATKAPTTSSSARMLADYCVFYVLNPCGYMANVKTTVIDDVNIVTANFTHTWYPPRSRGPHKAVNTSVFSVSKPFSPHVVPADISILFVQHLVPTRSTPCYSFSALSRAQSVSMPLGF